MGKVGRGDTVAFPVWPISATPSTLRDLKASITDEVQQHCLSNTMLLAWAVTR